MIEQLIFYTFATVLLISAFMVIVSKNPVHSVLFLIFSFFNAAGLFILIGAEFIATILVIVYVGAVAVLFLFVVMMLDIDFADFRRGMLKYAPFGAMIGVALLAELAWVYSAWTFSPNIDRRLAFPTPPPGELSNTHALGELIYTHYFYLFQLSGIILLVAMIGAIVLTLRTRPGVRKQSVSDQAYRKREDVIEIVKVTSGAGVKI